MAKAQGINLKDIEKLLNQQTVVILGAVDEKVSVLDKKIDVLDKRMDVLEKRFDRFEARLNKKMLLIIINAPLILKRNDLF